jgi:hypothetical protein
MPVPGDQHGWKTCLQVYNPAGFLIEFATVQSSPQRFDCVLSIVVWCRVPPHHHNVKSQPLSGWDFFCPFPQYWRGFAPWHLEHAPAEVAAPCALPVVFLSLFSADLLSIQGPKS